MKDFPNSRVWLFATVVGLWPGTFSALADERVPERAESAVIEETVVLPRLPVRRDRSLDEAFAPREPGGDSKGEIPTLDHSARNRVFEFVPPRGDKQGVRARPSGKLGR